MMQSFAAADTDREYTVPVPAGATHYFGVIAMSGTASGVHIFARQGEPVDSADPGTATVSATDETAKSQVVPLAAGSSDATYYVTVKKVQPDAVLSLSVAVAATPEGATVAPSGAAPKKKAFGLFGLSGIVLYAAAAGVALCVVSLIVVSIVLVRRRRAGGGGGRSSSSAPAQTLGQLTYVDPNNEAPSMTKKPVPASRPFAVAPPAKTAPREATAKFAFAGTQADELALLVGDRVVIVEEFDDGWALCRMFSTGVEGVVPLSYLAR